VHLLVGLVPQRLHSLRRTKFMLVHLLVGLVSALLLQLLIGLGLRRANSMLLHLRGRRRVYEALSYKCMRP
jgi:hypothetical protein